MSEMKFLINNRNLIFKRTFRMSAQLRAEKALEDLKKKNPYFEKYAGKIAALQQTSPEEFLERAEKVEEKRNLNPKESSGRSYAELLKPKVPTVPISPTADRKKSLADVMKLELVQDKTAEEINKIWLEYHKTKDVLAATIPVEQYEALMQQGKDHPIFIFPLPRSEGYEFIMLQFAANCIHYTPLLCYQVHKENAPECLNLVHYTELKDKGIVLMRGEYDHQVLNAKEAQCLANQLQLYYIKPDEKKSALLEKFTKQPENFKHIDLIKEMESIELK